MLFELETLVHRLESSILSKHILISPNTEFILRLELHRHVWLGCFMVVTFLIFSQGDWLFDIFMGVEVHDKKMESRLLGASQV